ncbi:MAG: hypothetical protein BWY46_00207 [Firmicutes bacterium ADurb.Bin300]|nr:MAG: hypothetical protein BWY46_00207 [Firmicutes bacterium ADurb.Bin300]
MYSACNSRFLKQNRIIFSPVLRIAYNHSIGHNDLSFTQRRFSININAATPHTRQYIFCKAAIVQRIVICYNEKNNIETAGKLVLLCKKRLARHYIDVNPPFKMIVELVLKRRLGGGFLRYLIPEVRKAFRYAFRQF